MEKGVHCEAFANNTAQKVEYKETIEGIDEWPNSWPDGEVSYRLNNFSPDFREKWQIRAVTVALRVWQWRVKNIRFRRERSSTAHVDFDVSFKSLSHFDNKKGILAHAYFPGQGDISGDCHINDEWDWVPGTNMQTLRNPPLVPILVHEFGHSLGLRHDTLTASQNTEIMYPSFNLGREKYKLGPRDIERIQERYGQRTLSQRIIRYFQNRRRAGGDFR